MFDKDKFKGSVYASGHTLKSVAEYLNISETTFYRKLKHNGSFSRYEINQLIDLLNIQNPFDIFFKKELAETQEERR
jgi:AraC-like DNA-binding protein